MDSQHTRALVRLREMILRGELAPGQRVAEAPLAEMLGLSRTPIRQALPVLAREGLLTEHETRGFVVRGFSVADILDAIDLRGLIEGMAARRVAERGASPELITALRACLDQGDAIFAKGNLIDTDEEAYAEMNSRFHELIVREAHSPMIEEAVERNSRIPFASAQAVAFGGASLEMMFQKLTFAHRQHHLIVNAIERRESSRVEALMREHANPVKDALNMQTLSQPAREIRHLVSVIP